MYLPCKFCQINHYNSDHFTFGKRETCNDCYQTIFVNHKFDWVFENGKIQVLYAVFEDKQGENFRIYFHYDVPKTVFTRLGFKGEQIVLTLNQTMPITEKFIKKATMNLQKWQVFS